MINKMMATIDPIELIYILILTTESLEIMITSGITTECINYTMISTIDNYN